MERTDAGTGAWTVARLLNWTRRHFEARGLDSPRLCAEILLAHAMRCPRIQLYAQHDAAPTQAVLDVFRAAVRQAAAGRPVAYITGVKEFFSLPFEVGPDVLIPRPETEVLVERTIDLVRRSAGRLARILDVGTGSGCIAISLARNLPDVAICASDIAPAALSVAKSNAARLGVLDRIELREGDLLHAWHDAPPFDAIVCNPPYLARSEAAELPANVRDYEPHVALFAGDDGLAFYRRLAREARAALAPQGHVLLEVAYNQADRVQQLFEACGWRDVRRYRDGLNHDRVVHMRPAAGA